MLRRLRRWWSDLPSGVSVREPLTNEPEARAVLAARVRQLRALGYEDLRALDRHDTFLGGRIQIGTGPAEREDVVGPSGLSYLLETQVLWDEEEYGNLRVWVTLYEQSIASRTLMDDFIIAPDGSFVGE